MRILTQPQTTLKQIVSLHLHHTFRTVSIVDNPNLNTDRYVQKYKNNGHELLTVFHSSGSSSNP